MFTLETWNRRSARTKACATITKSHVAVGGKAEPNVWKANYVGGAWASLSACIYNLLWAWKTTLKYTCTSIHHLCTDGHALERRVCLCVRIAGNSNEPQVGTNWKIKAGVNPHWDDTRHLANADGCLEWPTHRRLSPPDAHHNPQSPDRPSANQKIPSIC